MSSGGVSYGRIWVAARAAVDDAAARGYGYDATGTRMLAARAAALAAADTTANTEADAAADAASKTAFYAAVDAAANTAFHAASSYGKSGGSDGYGKGTSPYGKGSGKDDDMSKNMNQIMIVSMGERIEALEAENEKLKQESRRFRGAILEVLNRH